MLAEYTVHGRSPCCGLLTVLVLLNGVARWCNATQFFTKMVNFTGLCVWALELRKEFFQGGPLLDFFLGWAKSGEICFLPLETKKQHFLLKFSNSSPSSDDYPCLYKKFVLHILGIRLKLICQIR